MRLLLAILLTIFTSICYGKPLIPVPVSELATLPESQSILAGNQIGDHSVMLILSPGTSQTCSGTLKSCPDVRLYISVASNDKTKKPRLYKLPIAKGWSFGNWNILNPAENSEFVPFEFLVQTNLPDTNVDAKEQEQFKPVFYRIRINEKRADVDAGENENAITFSRYSSKLKQVSFDSNTSEASFKGSLTLRGKVFFEMDIGDGGRMAGVNFAKFVPLPDDLKLLPEVISGFYPHRIDYVAFSNPDDMLRATFGRSEAKRIAHGTNVIVHKDVEIKIKSFTTAIECDSRVYYVEVVSVKAIPSNMASNESMPSGC